VYVHTERRLCQTPLHGHRLRTCCTTPPTDKLTTMLYNKFATSQCQRPTSQHVKNQDVGMRQIFVRWWLICCTTSCSIVVSSSVGGVVQHVRSRCPCSGVWHLSVFTNSVRWRDCCAEKQKALRLFSPDEWKFNCRVIRPLWGGVGRWMNVGYRLSGGRRSSDAVNRRIMHGHEQVDYDNDIHCNMTPHYHTDTQAKVYCSPQKLVYDH